MGNGDTCLKESAKSSKRSQLRPLHVVAAFGVLGLLASESIESSSGWVARGLDKVSPELSSAENEALSELPSAELVSRQQNCNSNVDCGGLICRQSRCDFCRHRFECGEMQICELLASNGLGAREMYLLNRTSHAREHTTIEKDEESKHVKLDGVASYCRQKHLREPFTRRDLSGTAALFFASALANAGGLGGGTLFVPILTIITTFPARDASGLSQALVTGGSMSATVYQALRKHPERNGPLIDWDVLLLAVPSLLIGTLFGVYFADVLPSYMSSAILCALLAYGARVSFRSGVEQLNVDYARAGGRRDRGSFNCGLKNESNDEEQATRTYSDAALPRDAEPSTKHLDTQLDFKKTSCPFLKAIHTFVYPATNSSAAPTHGRSPRLPRDKIVFLVITWLITFSGARVRAKNAPCSKGDTIAVIGTLASLSLMTSMAATRLCPTGLHGFRTKQGSVTGAQDWSPRRVRLFVVFFICTGAVSTWIGIGPAAIMTPFLAVVGGFDARVVQAVSAVANALMSSSVVFVLALSDKLLLDYAVFFAFVAFAGAVVGLMITNRIIGKNRNLRGVVILVLSAVFCISLMLEVVIVKQQFTDAARMHTLFKLNPVCRGSQLHM